MTAPTVLIADTQAQIKVGGIVEVNGSLRGVVRHIRQNGITVEFEGRGLRAGQIVRRRFPLDSVVVLVRSMQT